MECEVALREYFSQLLIICFRSIAKTGFVCYDLYIGRNRRKNRRNYETFRKRS